jgi:lambda family phage portal protein
LSRNHPLVTGAIGTVVNGVAGSGLQLDAQIDRKALGIDEDEARVFEEHAERGFRLWSKKQHCDITRTQCFQELQGLAFRSVLESGDLLVLMPYVVFPGDPWGLKLQLIEADRISNPQNGRDTEKLTAGVECDEYGAPAIYHVQSCHPGDNNYKKNRYEWKAYEAFTSDGRRAALHLYERLRPEQHRGVPFVAPIIEKLKVLDEYTDAELRAAVVSAMFTVFTHLENGDSIQGIDPVASSTGATSTGSAADDDELKLEGGAILDLRPNEHIEFANPTRPNAQFDPFFKAIVQQIGVALGLPQEVLLKIFMASYSASRAALAEAHRFYMTRRTWLIRNFMEPVYEAWMTEAVASGYLDAPGYFENPIARQAYLGANWIGTPMIQIDPVKEIDAARGRVELGISTLTEECATLTGKNWDPVPEQRRWEIAQMSGITGGSDAKRNNEDPNWMDEEERRS